MFYSGNWIHSFPTHFQWSNATLVTKGMAPYGAVALGEIDWVVQRLHERIDEPQAWWEEWTKVAAQVERAGDVAAAEGRSATAGNYYLRAGNYYYTGERMVAPGEQKLGIYRKALRCYREGLKRRCPGIEFVDVPYEETALPAYFLKSPIAKGRAPPRSSRATAPVSRGARITTTTRYGSRLHVRLAGKAHALKTVIRDRRPAILCRHRPRQGIAALRSHAV